MLSLLSVLSFSCADSSKIEISKEEYSKLKGVNVYPKEIILNNNDSFMVYLASDLHEYIYNNNGYGDVYTHYPECNYCKSREKELKNK